MAQDDKITKYCELVCRQIRWKKTHAAISQELQDHLLEQRDAYVDLGYPEESAAERAILDFGDAATIGAQLDRVHRPKSQGVCFALLVMLCLSGLVAQNLAALSAPYGMMPQLLSYLIGGAILAGAYYLDFSALSKYALPFYIGIIVISVAVHVLPVYVNLKSCIVFTYPLAIACGIYRFRHKGYAGIVVSGLLAAILFAVSLWMNSMAGAILSLLTAVSVIPFSICRNWFRVKKSRGLLLWAGMTALGMAALILPELGHGFYRTDSYISGLIREVVQNAKWVGMATPTAHSLPSMHTDHILTFILYRFGWLAFGFVTALLLGLLLLCFRAAIRQKSILGQLVAVSITTGFTVQILGYFLTNLGVVGLPSFTLPFVSYGVFANLIHFALLGILLSVFRNGEIMTDPPVDVCPISA